jgi:hypothetical protein
MGAVLTGIVAAVVLAVGAGYVLQREQERTWEAFSTGSTRVGNPGVNLVGPDWSGNPRGVPAETAAGETAPSS